MLHAFRFDVEVEHLKCTGDVTSGDTARHLQLLCEMPTSSKR